MPELPWSQIGLLALEAGVVAVLLLALFRLRRIAGLSPLYITIGALQQLQVLLALTIYVELLPDLLVSPGSAVLFPASLFVILLVYLRHDASEARRLVYGLILANLSVGLLSWLVAHHIGSPAVLNFLELPRSFFLQNLRVLLAGTLTLYLDVVLLIVLYEALARRLGRWSFVHLYLTLAGVLAFDALVFVSGAFLGHPQFASLLASNMTGKVAMALPYAAVLALYLRYVGRVGESSADLPATVRRLDVFGTLSFRQRYEAAREEALRDALTGLHNRRFLTELLPHALARARRDDEELSLLVLDIDRFKQINDRLGHPAGDAVLRQVGQVLLATARAGDLVCRYGGDEIVLVMPGAGADEAAKLAQRIHAALAAAPPVAESASMRPTVSIGSASHPQDGDDADELLRRADERLYAGRRQR